MKVFAKKYVKSNPGGKAQVIGYLPRPLLKLTPPPDAKNKRILSYNFIEAVQKLPVNFEKDELQEIAKRAAQRFPGQLRTLFVVLNDDMVPRSRPRQKRPPSPSGQQGNADRRPRVTEVSDEFEIE